MIKTSTSFTRTISLIGVLVVIIALLIWGNFLFVKNNPGGNDFLVHWVGAQSFIKNGISPYSDTVALRIQEMVYGRAAIPGEHELRVAYPLYSILLFGPFGLINDFIWARTLWMALLEVSIFASVILSLRIVQWSPGKLITSLIFIFSIFWYHGLRSLVNGNAVVLLLFCSIFVVYAIFQKQDELAGIAMALMTIKPQVVLVFILFMLLWSLVNRRWKIVFWFFGALTLLILIGFFLIPDWPVQFLQEIVRYTGYNPPGTPAQALSVLLPGVGQRLGLLISITSGIILIIEWYLGRHSEGVEFFWVVSLTLALSQWLNIQTDPGNFVVMFPGIILVFKLVEDRWRKFGQLINLILLIVFFTIPWLFFIMTINYTYQPVQNPIMFFPLPFLLFLTLYWVRWWAKNTIKHTLK